jgi:hypothetical protein
MILKNVALYYNVNIFVDLYAIGMNGRHDFFLKAQW